MKPTIAPLHNEMCSIYKLNESTKTHSPSHFNSLVESLILERCKLKKGISETFQCFSVEEELIYCVALTVALEVGFRFRISEYLTQGFDIRAMKELTSLVNFRDFNNSCLKATLCMPCLDLWQFTVISTLVHYDFALYNVLALEGEQTRSTSSAVIPCSKYIRTNSKGLEMFEDIKTLSEIFTKAFCKLKNDAMQIAGVSKGLFCLPDELKRVIFYKLEAKDFANLCASCKGLWNFNKDEIIWRYFLTRDYAVNITEGGSHYSTYQSVAKQRSTLASTTLFHYATENVNSDVSIEFIEQGHYL